MNSPHTPTPWKQHTTEGKTYASIRGASNETIADCGSRSDQQAQANAAFIVTACNSHDKLVAALREAFDEICAENKNQALIDSINSVLSSL